MLFKFRNIGKIAEADIEINGLTVLGGHNDTGKSTIGKTLYSIIKTIRNSEKGYHQIQKEQIKNIISDLTIRIRKTIGVSLHYDLPQGYDITTLINKQKIIQDLSVLLENTKNYSSLVKEDEKIAKEVETLFKEAAVRISEISEEDADSSDKYKSVFARNNDLLFRGEFTNKKNFEKTSEITYNDFGKDLLTIVVDENIIKEFLLIEKFTFEDVTFIESPIVLNHSHYIRGESMFFSSMFYGYDADLINKISRPKSDNYEPSGDSQKKLISGINNIINGRLYYDENEGDFIFERDQNLKIKSINMASGIKAFGIIQLLIISGAINPDTLLIIDEPEVHLHPEWQLKYAKLITLLVDSGVYVLISSHSPYMIEALKKYSDKLKLDKITRFYVGNAHEKGTIFQDVTEDMEPLFHQLAIPMQKLTFE